MPSNRTIFMVFLLLYNTASLVAQTQPLHPKVRPPEHLAQHHAAKKSGVLSANRTATVRILPTATDWQVRLMPVMVSHAEQADLSNDNDEPENDASHRPAALFAERLRQKETRKAAQVSVQRSTATTTPATAAHKTDESQYITQSFEGNTTTNWYPPDNHLAISNGGIIVSVINSQVSYFDTDGNLLDQATFANLFADFDLSTDLFDPRVLYDETTDRFVMMILNDRTPANSKILLCFSVTNNPLNGWHLYELDGNPLDNGSWFDYPSVALSQNELYISGNGFSGGFDQALVYQIKKSDGYAGNTLSFQYWYDLTGNPFTLAPLSWGQQGSYGPGCYLIATQSANEGSSVKLYDLTDDLDNNPEMVYYNIGTDFFERGSNAYQQGSSNKMRTNGTVVRSAFYLDGVVHYAFVLDRQSGEANAAGWNGIAYNRLQVSTAINQRYILSNNDLDLAYPAIASAGSSTTDRSIVMGYLASGETIYPEARTIQFDDNMQPSGYNLVRAGANSVSVGCDGGSCRWGDYVGIQRRYNGNACWIMAQSPKGNGNWRNQIAEITPEAVGINPPNTAPKPLVWAYPNPLTTDLLYVSIGQTVPAYTRICLYDMLGKPIKVLFEGNVQGGEQLLSFNRRALPQGMYLLQTLQNGVLADRQKIVIF